MKHTVVSTLFSIIVLWASATLNAQTRLPAILSDNMCLQQSAEVKIWGWDNPGQSIRVKPSWTKAVKTETNQDGKWLVKITTPKAGKTGTIKVTGSSQKTIHNILFGEVWLCSGQSNMELPLGFDEGRHKPIVGFWDEVQAANYPKIRLFQVPKIYASQPADDCQGKWVECSPETVLSFSAVGFFYGKELHNTLNVPVGLIQSAWGGTPVEPWTPEEKYTEKTLKQIAQYERTYKADSAAYFKAVNDYKHGTISNYPKYPLSLAFHRRKHVHKAVLYNGMISPLVNFRIKGAIWYQGEANVPNWKDYKTLFPNMITSWREKWNKGNFPFYLVQIAPNNYSDKFGQPQITEAQCEALKLKNTGIAATQDIGVFYDIHPPQKREVGRRLSLIALHKTYGKTDVVYSGPVLTAVKTNGNKLELQFNTPGSALVSAKDPIGGIPAFYIAGENKIFYKANVKREGNTILLKSAKVEKPVAARYNWANNANATLFNTQGLPALPFRTDNWDEAVYGK